MPKPLCEPYWGFTKETGSFRVGLKDVLWCHQRNRNAKQRHVHLDTCKISYLFEMVLHICWETPSWQTIFERGWHVSLERIKPFTNTSRKPGRLMWFINSSIDLAWSSTNHATAYLIWLKGYYCFSTELPLNNRHLFWEYQSSVSVGVAYCYQFSSAFQLLNPFLIIVK